MSASPRDMTSKLPEELCDREAPAGGLVVRPGRQAPQGETVVRIFVSVISGAFITGALIVHFAHGSQECQDAVPRVAVARDASGMPTPQRSLSVAGYALAAVLGQSRQLCLQASGLVLVSFFSAFLCTVTSAYVVTFKPEMVQIDFEEKATLSNVSQDVTTPRGRMFAVMLFTACLLSIVSMYTFNIYPGWFNASSSGQTRSFTPLYEQREEKFWRILWATFPNAGFVFTALLPSLSNNQGTMYMLSVVHNIAAPVSMAMALIMETVQLSYGENAFAYFFCGDEYASWSGPLQVYQRARVVVLCYTWLSIVVFLGIQVYLALGTVCGMRIRTSYSLALVSFYSEITALVLVFSLPAIQGFAIMVHLFWESVFQDAGLLMNVIDAANGTAPQLGSARLLRHAQTGFQLSPAGV